MKTSLSILIIILINTCLSAQEIIPFDKDNFSYKEREPLKKIKYKGKESVYLNGKALLKGIEIGDGIVEVDFVAARPRSFVGLLFRAQDDENHETLYVRLHKSGMPDALQYNPEYNGEGNWQLYGEHQGIARFDLYKWNHLKAVFKGSTLNVFLNEEAAPVLTVNNLRREDKSGFIGFYSFLGAYFANFSYQEFGQTVPFETQSNEEPGVIRQWEISESFLAEEVNRHAFPGDDFLGSLKWQKGEAESSGLLAINKYVRKKNGGEFEKNIEELVWVRYIFEAEKAGTQLMNFDFSDQISFFFNKQLLYSGNNSFRSKGLTFRGDIHLKSNSLYLNVRKGKNEILCAVVDKANGWGLLGQFESMMKK